MFRQANRKDSDSLDKFIYYRELGYSVETAELLSRITYGDEDLTKLARKFKPSERLQKLCAWFKEQENASPEEVGEDESPDLGNIVWHDKWAPPKARAAAFDEGDAFYCSYKMPVQRQNHAQREMILHADSVNCCLADRAFSPFEDLATDSYEDIEEKDAKSILTAPTSTFRMTTSNASMGIIFNQMRNGRSLDMSQIRIEELLNAFEFDARYPDGQKFRISTELMPKGENKELLYINVQAAKEEKEHQNIVLLLDVSGSMSSNDEVTQEAIATIFSKLKVGDTISLVTYSDTDHTVIDGYTIKSDTDKELLMGVLMGIEIDGCTHGSAGIMTAYELGKRHYRDSWSNQVILITDGDLNFGITGKHELKDLIEEKKKSSLFLSVIGTGLYNYKDDKLETLSKHGNGTYCVVNSLPDVDEFINKRYVSLTNIIAKDVKAQVEFNPKFVKSYRLLGYENRELNHEDFRNDAVISEPYGSGGHGIALYEIERSSGELISDLKYMRHTVVDSEELGTIRIRYKEPLGEESQEIEHVFYDTETGIANAKLAYLVYCIAERDRLSEKMDDDDKVFLWRMMKDSAFRNIAGTPGNEEKLACLLKKPH